MQYIQRDKLVHIEWSIFRGTSHVPEDFSRALVKMFLIGGNEKYLLTAMAEGGKLLADLPGDLPEGAYSLEAIWVKNYGNLLPHRQPLTPGGEPVCPRRPGPHPNDPCFIHPHDNRFNDRCLMRSRKDYVFALTDYPSEETVTGESGEVTVRLASSVATYGYDGLSAYQIAVMRGDFSGTEGEFLAQSGFTKLKTINGESLIGEGDIEITGGTLETATETKLGGIRAATKTQDETVEVKIDPETGKLYVPKAEEEALEVATENKLGGIKAAAKTSLETQEVKIDPVTGKLYTKPGGEGGTEIINNPDEEDLHSVEKSADVHVLQFADKEYNASAFSGLGRVYLRKNISSNKNILTQAMMSKANTRYIIQYDYDLDGETITMPENITLEFQGGGLRNGTLNGNKCLICSTSHVIFDNVTLMGTFVNSSFESIWFGVLEGEDCTAKLQKAIDNAAQCGVKRLMLNKGKYTVSDTISLPSYFDFGGLNNGSNAVWKQSGELPFICQTVNKPILKIGNTSEVIRNLSVHDMVLSGEDFLDNKGNLHGIYGKGKGCSNNIFKNLWIYKCRFGFSFEITDYGGIAQNVWENVALTFNTIGFYLLGVEDDEGRDPWFNINTFRNCYINDNSAGGIYTSNIGSTQALLIQSCNIENNGNGITDAEYEEYGCFGVRLSVGFGLTSIDSCYIENNYPRNDSGILPIEKSKEGGLIMSGGGTLHVTNCLVSHMRQFVLVTAASSIILESNDYNLLKVDDYTSKSLVRYLNINNSKNLRLIIHEDKFQSGAVSQAYEFDYSSLTQLNTFYNSYIDIDSQTFEKEKYGDKLYHDNPTFYINSTLGNANYTGLSKAHPFRTMRNLVSYGDARFARVKTINFDLQSDSILEQDIGSQYGRMIVINGNDHILTLKTGFTLNNSSLHIKDCHIVLDYGTDYFSYVKCYGACKITFENCTISFKQNVIGYLVDCLRNSNTDVSFIDCTISREDSYKTTYLTSCRDYSNLRVFLSTSLVLPSNVSRNDSDFISKNSVEYNNPVNVNIKRYEDSTKFVYSDDSGNFRNLDGTLYSKVIIV